MIDYALKTAGVGVGDINLFASANGPGSFTGIRIGVATIKGLAFGGGNNCVSISSLRALAYNFMGFSEDALIFPVIDARRRQVYNAAFNHNSEYIIRDRIITLDELERELNLRYADRSVIFAGDGADMCYDGIKFGNKIKPPEALKIPSAVSLCAAALREYKKNGAVGASKLAPAYLIKTQAEREYEQQ
jgi:tRNA threonylcarbamoyladenosine biosynthesis protein TsaB